MSHGWAYVEHACNSHCIGCVIVVHYSAYIGST